MSDDNIPEPDCVEGAPHPRQTPALFGQSKAEASFLAAYNTNRLHHAWLLTGPRGVGKATLAWRIARFLLSLPVDEGAGLFGDDDTPLTTLDTSLDLPINRRIAALSEPRLYLCRRPWDAKTDRLRQAITVDEVRKLKSFFNLSAADGGRRVVIVDAVDEMNANAANALLKILEEPPEKATLLLVSHRPAQLLATIRSRCRVLKCGTLAPDDMTSALGAAGFDAGPTGSALNTLADGSVGEAIRLLSQDGLNIYASLAKLVSDTPGMDRLALIKFAESCGGKAAVARYDLVLGLIGILLHRLAVTGVSGPPAPEVSLGEAEMLIRLSGDAQTGRNWADLAQTLTARSDHARAVNLDPASVILDMLLKIDQTAGTRRAA